MPGRSKTLNRFDVRFGGVSLIAIPAVVREFLVQISHVLVAVHLGNKRSSGDDRAIAVCLHLNVIVDIQPGVLQPVVATIQQNDCLSRNQLSYSASGRIGKRAGDSVLFNLKNSTVSNRMLYPSPRELSFGPA